MRIDTNLSALLGIIANAVGAIVIALIKQRGKKDKRGNKK